MALYFYLKSFAFGLTTFLDFGLGHASVFMILTLLLPHVLPVCWAHRRRLLIVAPGEVTMFLKVNKVDNTDGVRRSLFSHHVHQGPALTVGTEFEDLIVKRGTVSQCSSRITVIPVITTLENVIFLKSSSEACLYQKGGLYCQCWLLLEHRQAQAAEQRGSSSLSGPQWRSQSHQRW